MSAASAKISTPASLILSRRELSIIHTDFKPENVMLVDPVKPRVFDIQLPSSKPSAAALPGPPAAGAAAGSGAASALTKNQKKKQKRKAKKTGGAQVGLLAIVLATAMGLCAALAAAAMAVL